MPISEIIMPSQTIYSKSSDYGDMLGKVKQIHVNQSVTLDAREYFEQGHDQSTTKVIIHAYGNADRYEYHTRELLAEAEQFPGCKVIGFNFRNVCASTGAPARSEKDWVNDAIAVIDYYHIRENIPYSDILLSGESLGAAILTMAAAEIYKREKTKAKKDKSYKADCVKLINGRSFRTLGSVVCNIGFVPFLLGAVSGITLAISLVAVGISLLSLTLGSIALITLAGISGLIIPIILSTVFPLAFANLYTPVVNLFLSMIFGKMDALSAYKTLPGDCKNYYHAKHDTIICGNSGLVAGLRNEKQQIKKQLKQTTPGSSIQKELETRLFAMRSRKLASDAEFDEGYGGYTHTNDHNEPLQDLKVSKCGKHTNVSGQIVYYRQVAAILNLKPMSCKETNVAESHGLVMNLG